MTLSTFLQLQEITQRLGLSRSTIYKLISAGEFPPPVKLTRRASRWRASEVDAFVAMRSDRPSDARASVSWSRVE